MSLTTEGRPGRIGAFLDAVTVYFRPRVLIVLLLGFSAGLPLALSGETLRVWLADRGVALGATGAVGVVGAVTGRFEIVDTGHHLRVQGFQTPL